MKLFCLHQHPLSFAGLSLHYNSPSDQAAATSQTDQEALTVERVQKAKPFAWNSPVMRHNPTSFTCKGKCYEIKLEDKMKWIQEAGNSRLCVPHSSKRWFLVMCLHWWPAAGRLSRGSSDFPVNTWTAQNEWNWRMEQYFSNWFQEEKLPSRNLPEIGAYPEFSEDNVR